MIGYLPKGLEWKWNVDTRAFHAEIPYGSFDYFSPAEGIWVLERRDDFDIVMKETIHNSEEAAKAAAEAHHLEEWLKTAKPVEWISVWDRLPEDFGRYLVFNECVYIASFDGKGWRTEEPTHWLPLPSEPVDSKGEEQNEANRE